MIIHPVPTWNPCHFRKPHHLNTTKGWLIHTTCTLRCWSHIRRFQLFRGLRQKKTDGSLMVRVEIRRENPLRLVVDIPLFILFIIYKVLYVPGGWPWDFWTEPFNSMSMISLEIWNYSPEFSPILGVHSISLNMCSQYLKNGCPIYPVQGHTFLPSIYQMSRHLRWWQDFRNKPFLAPNLQVSSSKAWHLWDPPTWSCVAWASITLSSSWRGFFQVDGWSKIHVNPTPPQATRSTIYKDSGCIMVYAPVVLNCTPPCQKSTAGGVLNAFCIPCLKHQFKFECLVTGFRPSSPSKPKLAQVKTCTFKETHICNRSIFCLASGPHHLRLARYRGPFYTQLAASSLGSRRPVEAKTLLERDINFIEESHSLVNTSDAGKVEGL